jgi:ribosomal protein S18 acetylase RimI-like enzyme
MFVTRATRHDRSDISELLNGHGYTNVNLDEGTAFIARDGAVVGCVRLVEVQPQSLVVDDLLVHEDHRRQGIGLQLMQTAMNSRGGTMWLVTHPENVDFYRQLAFGEAGFEKLPDSVVEYFEKVGDHPTPPDHVHIFMRAR